MFSRIKHPDNLIVPHVVKVREDKGLVDIKATGNDVLGVLHSKVVALFHSQLLPQVLLIICQLDRSPGGCQTHPEAICHSQTLVTLTGAWALTFGH